LVENKAYEWILDILESKDIPYLICGGLAAIAYGSKRPLNDIDVFVSKANYRDLVEQGREYVTFGPERYKDQFWNIDYVQFTVGGQKIEIGSNDRAKIFDATKNEWVPISIDFDSYSIIRVLGKEARIMKKSELIEYKRKLGREVDIVDINQIKNA